MKGIKRFRRLGGAFMAVAMLCSVLTPGAVFADRGDPATDGASLTVVPDSQAVSTGDTVMVDVEVAITDTVTSTGAQMKVAYDETVLSFVGATQGTAYAGATGSVMWFGFPPTASGGLVSNMAVSVIGGDLAGPASGTLVTLEFAAIGSGVSPITITDGSVASGASPLPIEIYDGTVGVDLPDLVISSKSESWVAAPGGDYMVEFTVENQGNGAAGAFDCEVTADGGQSTIQAVAGLAGGASQTFTVGPFTFDAPDDTVVVTADIADAVAEGDETNNSLSNVWRTYQAKLTATGPGTIAAGTPFDVVVSIDAADETRGAQAAFSFDPAYVECTGITVGDFYSNWASANGATAMWFGHTMPTLVIDNAAGTVSNVAVALVGGTGGPTGTGTFITYHMEGVAGGVAALDVVGAQVSDVSGSPMTSVVVENDTVTVTGGPKPTVEVLAKSETWDVVGSTYFIHYTIGNYGSGNAGASNTGITIDGVEVLVEPCPALPSGTEIDFTVGPFAISGESDDICVISDYYDEVPNQKSDRVKEMCNTFGGQPDLVVSDKYEEWDIVGYSYTITYTVTNQGDVAAAASTTSVNVDGTEVETPACSALAVGASETVTVGPFTMTGDGDVINICADRDGDVAESNESNNCLENAMSIYGDGCYTELYANIAPEITITCPPDEIDWLLHVGDNTYSGILNIKSNTSWQCDVSDEDLITAGHMTKWDGFSYGTQQLINPMIVECVSEGTSVELAGPGKIAEGDTSGQNGNLGEDFMIDFNQVVEWADGVLVDGSVYHIVVSFNASVNV